VRTLVRFAVSVVFATATSVAIAADHVSIVDYCDPADPGWAATVDAC